MNEINAKIKQWNAGRRPCMMETIDKLDRIGWIVYVGSVAGMLFMVISALLE